MRAESLSHGFQTIASLAVIAGLALVVYELRQTKQLSGAELAAVSYGRLAQRELAALGENPAPALVRACLEPDAVTAEDARILVSYYQQILYELSAMIEVELIGEWGTAERWKSFAPGTLLPLLTTEHGRWYWNWAKPTLFPRLRELGDQVLEEVGPGDCAIFMENFRKRLPMPRS